MIVPFFRLYKNKEGYNMTSANASEIVESYRGALAQGDYDTARRLMQDNMTFQVTVRWMVKREFPEKRPSCSS
jgi:hypothetical protein